MNGLPDDHKVRRFEGPVPFKALLQALEAMCEVERGSVTTYPLPMELGSEEQAQAPDTPGH